MLRLSIRHLRRHWQLNLIMFLGVLMGATLAAALPMYTRAVADLTVQNTMQASTIAQRNLTLTGNINAGTITSLDKALDGLVLERREMGLTRATVLQQISRPDGTVDETQFSNFFADVWSIDPLQSEVVLVEGRMPSSRLQVNEQGALARTVIEVAIGRDVAESEDIELGVGDKLRLGRLNVDLEIVGLVEPRDPNADIWFGDATLLRFQASRFVDASVNIDEMRLGVLMPMGLLKNFITSNSEWRYLLDHSVIDAGNMGDVHRQLLAVQSQEGSATERVQTGLITILEKVQAEHAQAQAVLYLLLIQSLLAILYTLVLFTQFAIEQAQRTFGTLMGRGFNRFQLTRMFALSSGLLFIGLALPMAPLIAFSAVRLWSRGEPDLQVIELPLISWQLAGGVVLICWLMVIIAAYVSTGRNLLDWMRQRTRPGDSEAGSRRLVLELFILAAGGLAYWQMQTSGGLFDATTTETRFGGGDPILLLAPTLILLGIGLLALRLLPFLLSFIARLSKRSSTFLAPVSLLRLARDTTMPTRVVLLITFTVALALFATVMNGSLNQRQSELARYTTGADLRLRLPLDGDMAEAEIEQLTADPSIQSASQVVRGRSVLADEPNNAFINVEILAVDPSTLPDVSYYPPNLSPFTLSTVVSILETDELGVLPLVIGSNRQTLHINRGDRFELLIGRSTIPVEIVGIIETFPTLNQNFLVTSLPILETLTDIEDPTLENEHVRELWLDVVAGQHGGALTLAGQLPTDVYLTRILGDAVAQTDAYQAGLIARETSAALQINMIVLLALSAVGFLTIQYFSTQQRFAEFGVMQALGIGRQAWFKLISAEAVAMLIMGLVLGAILGTALSLMMRPLLVSLLASSTGSEGGVDLIFSPFSLAVLLGILLLVYGAAIALLNVMLRRSDLQKQLRLTQE
ncbi:MAG: FtsX-like permease family protein [Anaerolineae bacterium]